MAQACIPRSSIGRVVGRRSELLEGERAVAHLAGRSLVADLGGPDVQVADLGATPEVVADDRP